MHRSVLILSSLLLAVLILLAALPWWLGPAARRVAIGAGATFSEYQRMGYGRFALEEVRITTESITVTLARIEADTPLRWAWAHLTGHDRPVKIGEWSVESHPKKAATETPSTGWPSLRRQIDTVAESLARWLPEAEAGSGTVSWPKGSIAVEGARWSHRQLALRGVTSADLKADITLDWPADDGKPLRLGIVSKEKDWTVVLTENAGVVAGSAKLWAQPITLHLRFDETGWWPLEATLAADKIEFAGEKFKLGESYTRLHGGFRIEWRNKALTFEAQAEGEPLAGVSAPPLQVKMSGNGSQESVTIAAMEVQLPGMKATLDAPVRLEKPNWTVAHASRFLVEADLAKLPGAPAQGLVSGLINVKPGRPSWPEVEGSLKVTGFAFRDFPTGDADVTARLRWPELQIERARFVANDKSTLEGKGGLNFSNREMLAVEIKTDIAASAVQRFLPKSLTFERATATVKAAGAWLELEHEGQLEISAFTQRGLRPSRLELAWTGQGTACEIRAAKLMNDRATLEFSGTLGADSLELRQATVTMAGETEALHLTNPARLHRLGNNWRGEFALTGKTERLSGSLRWMKNGGDAALHAENFRSAWIDAFAPLPGPAWTLMLESRGNWGEGPLVFAATGQAGFALPASRAATIDFQISGDESGVTLAKLEANESGTRILRAQGNLPVSLWPQHATRLELLADRKLALEITSDENAGFWEQLGALTGVTLESPHAEVHLRGSLQAPEGTATLVVARVSADPKRWARALPDIEAFSLRLSGAGRGLALDELTLKLAGQEVRATGQLPVLAEEWRTLINTPWALAKKGGELRLEIPNAELAALAPYLPAYLAPVGQLQASLTFKPGGEIEGTARLQQAASRPLGPLGALQDVTADVRFLGRKIELREVSARAGGQPVKIAGTAELPRVGPPKLDLTLRGTNLPFIRQAGLLLRGDLDLQAKTDESGITVIRGKTHLRKSLLLAEWESLIPRGGRATAPARRPPYFSVEIAPFDAWRLDVQVDGDRFLRLRTPLFSGTASAAFRLSGTLREPRAIGEARLTEGRVTLPFATFTLQQGNLRLTEAQAYDPQLSAIGTARRYGYDLRLELNGTAAAPNLQFSSSPPLESEQVLLMVMAGEAPRDEMNYTSNQRAIRVGAYLAQSLLADLGGNAEASERLNLTTGEKVSRQGRETYAAEYQLNKRWSLVGEYDEFDDYNAGFKWHLRPRVKKEAIDAP